MIPISGPPRAAILGGGIAGLCASIALRRAGWAVTLYERSRFANEVGAAMSVSPSATRVLDRFGFDYTRARPVANNQTRHLGAEDLRVLMCESHENVEEKFGAKAWCFHRVDLHEGLLNLALGKKGKGKPVELVLGCEIKDVDLETGTVVKANGEEVQKDLVVVADGAHSSFPSKFAGSPRITRPTGRSVYRCLIPMDKIRKDELAFSPYKDQPTGLTGFVDSDIFFMSYPCRGGDILNLAIVHATQRGEGEKDAWNSPASVSKVLDTLSNFHEAPKRVVSLAEDADVKVYHLLKRAPLDSFVRGRACIIGDAAHVMLPTHAGGAAVAIESAGALEVLFNVDSFPEMRNGMTLRSETIQERLQMFDRLRIPRCNSVMIVSNGGPRGLTIPGVEEEVRKYYNGPLFPKDDMPWSEKGREWLFGHDSVKEAEELLKESRGGVTSHAIVL